MIVHCSHDEMVKLSDLKSHPKNRNKHPEDQIKRLADILTYQGWRYPVKVSKRSGLVTSGHGRIEAARLNGWEQAPVSFQDYDTDEQEYADVQADNAIASWAELDLSGINTDVTELGPDFDIDMLGIKDFVLEPAEMIPQAGDDDVPEHVEPRTKLGDIYQLGRHRLMCGDSTSVDAVDALMAGEKADMVFTDPPYGISIVGGGKAFGSVGGGKAFGSVGGGKIVAANTYSPVIGDNTTDTARDAFNLCASLEIPVLIFWGGNHYSSNLPDSSCWIVWDKDNTGNFADAELAWTNQKTAVRIFKHTWNGLIKASERNEKRCHPTQKPIALAEWCFEKYGEDSKSVLDLFGGSGSTLIACEKTNRKCFMMELDPHYCDVIVTRWENYTGKTAELLNGPQES